MSRHVVTLAMASLFLGVLLVVFSIPVFAATILINDGQSSVVSTGGSPDRDLPNQFVVRDLGCGVPDPAGQPCATAGTPTHVEFGPLTDGTYAGQVDVSDSSSIVLDGLSLLSGTGRFQGVGGVGASGTSHVYLRSGTLGFVDLSENATATMISSDPNWGPYGINLVGHSEASVTGGTLGCFGCPYGGTFGGLTAVDDSRATLNDVTVAGVSLAGDARVELNGVRVLGAVNPSERAHLEIADSSFYFFNATGGTVDMRSGSLGRLFLIDAVVMSVFGGTFTSADVYGTSELRINAASFRLNGVPINFGAVTATQGVLDITYSDGQSYSVPFTRGATSDSVLLLTPEPNTALLMLLGLAGLSWRRCHDPGKETE